MRLTRASASLERQFRHRLARIVPTTRTVPDAPGCTWMLPDPDETERSTVPLTFSVRSNLAFNLGRGGRGGQRQGQHRGGAGRARRPCSERGPRHEIAPIDKWPDWSDKRLDEPHARRVHPDRCEVARYETAGASTPNGVTVDERMKASRAASFSSCSDQRERRQDVTEFVRGDAIGPRRHGLQRAAVRRSTSRPDAARRAPCRRLAMPSASTGSRRVRPVRPSTVPAWAWAGDRATRASRACRPAAARSSSPRSCSSTRTAHAAPRGRAAIADRTTCAW